MAGVVNVTLMTNLPSILVPTPASTPSFIMETAAAASATTASSVCLPWVLRLLGECAENSMRTAGILTGFLSIGCWVLTTAPQLIANVRNGHARSLSAAFLTLWCLGDVCNLMGAILTKQLKTQIYTAAYFVAIDVFLLLQYLYYEKWRNVRRKERLRNRCDETRQTTSDTFTSLPSTSQDRCPDRMSTGSLVEEISSRLGRSLSSNPHRHQCQTSAVTMFMPTAFLVASFTFAAFYCFQNGYGMGQDGSKHHFVTAEEAIGYFVGCLSTLLYVASRIPQIVKNCERQSTHGLSLTMFMMAVFGNFTYTMCLLLLAPWSRSWVSFDTPISDLLTSADTVYCMRKMPWIVGSAGTLIFDFVVFGQFAFYGSTRRTSANVNGHSPWYDQWHHEETAPLCARPRHRRRRCHSAGAVVVTSQVSPVTSCPRFDSPASALPLPHMSVGTKLHRKGSWASLDEVLDLKEFANPPFINTAGHQNAGQPLGDRSRRLKNPNGMACVLIDIPCSCAQCLRDHQYCHYGASDAASVNMERGVRRTFYRVITDEEDDEDSLDESDCESRF